MNKALLALIMILSVAGCGKEEKISQENAGLVKTITYNTNKKDYEYHYEEIYYKDGKEIARQKHDQKDHVLTTVGAIPDGIFKTYSDKKLFMEETFKDGKRNGLRKYFYKSGKLKSELNYKNDRFCDMWKSYYENGTLESEFYFENGRATVLQKMYFENGKLKSEVTFINENPMNGKEYYESGMLNREENVVEGKRIVTEYNINGTVSSTVTYNNDKGYEGSKFRSFW